MKHRRGFNEDEGNRMTLYEITGDWKAWEKLVDEVYSKCEEESRAPTDTEMMGLLDFRSENEVNLDHKLENITKYIKNCSSDADEIDAEIKRLQKKKKAKENLADRLKNYLDFTLKNLKIDKRKVGVFTLSIQKNPPSLEYELENVPSEWLIPQPAKVDVAGIKQAMKDGAKFDWCELRSTESIRIR